MTSAPRDRPATAAGDQYRALLAVSEAIAWHRDLPALFHELAGRLASLYLKDAALNHFRGRADFQKLVAEVAAAAVKPPAKE